MVRMVLACFSNKKGRVPGWPYRTASDPWLCFLRVPHQDLTDSSSFERAKFWVKELRNLEEVGGLTSPKDETGAGDLVARGG